MKIKTCKPCKVDRRNTNTRVNIPLEVREHLGLEHGDLLVFEILENGRVRIKKVIGEVKK